MKEQISQAQNRPNLILRSLWAGIVVSFLAGPIFLWLLIAIGEPEPDSELPLRAGDIGVLLCLFPSVSVVGLVGAVPASIANALVVVGLAKKRIDGLVPATISAATWGVILPVIAFRLFGREQRNLIGGEYTLTAVTCLALTGMLLGIVHWMIAVRPYRVWRLQSKNDC